MSDRVTDHADYERFFRAEHGSILGLAIALTGDHHAARDVVQESFLRAYRDWGRIRSLDAPGAWLRRVAVNLAIDRHRRLTNERRALERHLARTPATVELDDPAADAWWDAVRRLPERQQAAVALHYLEDLSIERVATVLEIAPGTVKSTLSKARQSLSRTLIDQEVDR